MSENTHNTESRSEPSGGLPQDVLGVRVQLLILLLNASVVSKDINTLSA